MTEIWKPVVGFEEFYEVSNLGRVRSIARQLGTGCRGSRWVNSKIQKGGKDQDGYHIIGLSFGSGNRITKRVHRLVLEAFIGPCPDGMECLHGDGVPDNNTISNLSWDTPTENWKDRHRHGRGIDGERNPHSILRRKHNV